MIYFSSSSENFSNYKLDNRNKLENGILRFLYPNFISKFETKNLLKCYNKKKEN